MMMMIFMKIKKKKNVKINNFIFFIVYYKKNFFKIRIIKKINKIKFKLKKNQNFIFFHFLNN